MRPNLTTGLFFLRITLAVALLGAPVLHAEPVRVRHSEGLVHGFLLLRSLEGKVVAEGDLAQNTIGNIVTSRLTYHFKDGSLHEESSVFSQSRTFHLLKYHLTQKGPAFPHQQDLMIDAKKGEVSVSYTDDDGKEKVTHDRLDVPADLANGIMQTVMKNIRPSENQVRVSIIAATPKPLVVKLQISPDGEETFKIGDSQRKASRFEITVEIPGIKGWFAHLMGKQPPPTKVWILDGTAPAFVKSEGPLCMDCPVWRTELASPVWEEKPAQESGKESGNSRQ